MTEEPFKPGDQLRIEMKAEQIVADLLKIKTGLIDEAFTAFGAEPVEDISQLLSSSATGKSPGELDELDEPELIEADDEDIEDIMRELLEENPEFAGVEEDERRQIVIEAIYEVLSQKT